MTVPEAVAAEVAVAVVVAVVVVAVAVAELLADGSMSPIFARFAAKINSFFLSAISLLTRNAALSVSLHISYTSIVYRGKRSKISEMRGTIGCMGMVIRDLAVISYMVIRDRFELSIIESCAKACIAIITVSRTKQ